MNYVVTAAGIEKIGTNLKATDKVYIFYKGSDMLRIDTVVGLLQIKAQKEFIRYATKEELMINFGFLAAKIGNLNVLDETIPVPDMLKGKISTKSTVKRGRPAKRVESVSKEKSCKKKETEIVVTEEKPKRGRKKVTESAEPKPVDSKETKTRKQKATESTESKVNDIKEGKSDDPVVESLKKVLKISASDFQYSMGTNFMMGRIKLYVSETPNDEDLKRALDFNFRGDKDHIVSDTVLKNIKKVRKIVSEG